jgi:excinuclease ABC subunit B
VDGQVLMYADQVTDSMQRMIDVTRTRRAKQLAYNQAHGITPRSIQKSIQESLATVEKAEEAEQSVVRESGVDYNVHTVLADMEREMLEAAQALEFERAALLRDQIHELRRAHRIEAADGRPVPGPVTYQMQRKGGRGRKAAPGRTP